MIITNVRVIYSDKIQEGNVRISGNKIMEINTTDFGNEEIFNGDGCYLSPGFIDIHIHGAGGQDTMDCSSAALNSISNTLASNGTTAFLPTTITAPKNALKLVVEEVKSAMEKGTSGAEILGLHLEGPFLNKHMAGAQNADYIIEPNNEVIDEIIGENYDIVKIVALAPELTGAKKLICHLKNKGIIIAAGHSAATFDEAIASFKAGVAHVTHLYNAMSGFNHKASGLVGAAFDSDVTAELICDGYHVAYPAIRTALKQKGNDKLILVSDAMMACSMPEGEYFLGELPVTLKDGKVTLKNGTLAGSALTLLRAIKNLYYNTGLELYEVIKMATINPAMQCNVANRKGKIAIDYDADLVLFDEAINIKCVFIRGKLFKS